MRQAGYFNAEWGYLAPAPNFLESAPPARSAAVVAQLLAAASHLAHSCAAPPRPGHVRTAVRTDVSADGLRLARHAVAITANETSGYLTSTVATARRVENGKFARTNP